MFLPTSSDSTAVFALLATITNPEQAKKNLEEISTASKDYQEKMDNLRYVLQKEQELQGISDEIDTREDSLFAREEILASSQKDAENRIKSTEAALAQAQLELNIQKDTFEKSSKVLKDELEMSLTNARRREYEADAREQEARNLIASNSILRANYEQKTEALQKALSQ